MPLAPWPKVISGLLGKFSIVCLVVCIILAVSLLIQGSIYVKLVSTHPSILCLPRVVSGWFILHCIIWFSQVCALIFVFIFLHDFKNIEVPARCTLIFCILALLTLPSLFLSLDPLTNQNYALVKSYNSTIMYQYLNGKVYPVIRPIDGKIIKDLNLTCCNPTCFCRICPCVSSLPPHLGCAQYVYKCQRGNQEDFDSFSSFMKPFSIYARLSVNLEIAASFFMICAVILFTSRRFNYLYGSRAIESIGERSPLVIWLNRWLYFSPQSRLLRHFFLISILKEDDHNKKEEEDFFWFIIWI